MWRDTNRRRQLQTATQPDVMPTPAPPPPPFGRGGQATTCSQPLPQSSAIPSTAARSAQVQMPLADQESEADYVFICEQAQLLVVPLKMEGKHKIYQLDKKIWTSARTQAGT